MKINRNKTIVYDYILSLTEREYKDFLQLANTERGPSQKPMTRIKSITVALTSDEDNYTKDTLNLSVAVRTKQGISR
jgi:hypothetical protein